MVRAGGKRGHANRFALLIDQFLSDWRASGGQQRVTARSRGLGSRRVRRQRGDNNSVTEPEIDIDYVPSHVRDWAERHLELLELVAEDLVTSGSWPEISVLTKRLAGAGKPTPLRSIFWGMPKPLGWIDHNPERIVLSLHGLRLTVPPGPCLTAISPSFGWPWSASRRR